MSSQAHNETHSPALPLHVIRNVIPGSPVLHSVYMRNDSCKIFGRQLQLWCNFKDFEAMLKSRVSGAGCCDRHFTIAQDVAVRMWRYIVSSDSLY